MVLDIPRWKRCGLKNFNNQNRVMGSQRPARFGYDIRMRYIVFIARVNKCADWIIYILLYCIINTALAVRRACTIIVNSQSASDIDKFNVKSKLAELNIKLWRFAKCNFYPPYFCDLASNMKMNQLDTISHLVFLNIIYCFK